jgi:putative RNA 2'-phosphotransferase
MTDKERIRTSKFLSLILRHEPERVGLKLDHAGWVNVKALLQAVNRNGVALTIDELEDIVETNSKKRFAFSDDNRRIRANQGHSVDVDLQYPPEIPPEVLYHGTATRSLQRIRKDGLRKMGRHDVHLSAETSVTVQVGGRHGKPVVLIIRAGDMHRAGHVFRCSANGVWLVNYVPPEFIQFPKTTSQGREK